MPLFLWLNDAKWKWCYVVENKQDSFSVQEQSGQEEQKATEQKKMIPSFCYLKSKAAQEYNSSWELLRKMASFSLKKKKSQHRADV